MSKRKTRAKSGASQTIVQHSKPEPRPVPPEAKSEPQTVRQAPAEEVEPIHLCCHIDGQDNTYSAPRPDVCCFLRSQGYEAAAAFLESEEGETCSAVRMSETGVEIQPDNGALDDPHTFLKGRLHRWMVYTVEAAKLTRAVARVEAHNETEACKIVRASGLTIPVVPPAPWGNTVLPVALAKLDAICLTLRPQDILNVGDICLLCMSGPIRRDTVVCDGCAHRLLRDIDAAPFISYRVAPN